MTDVIGALFRVLNNSDLTLGLPDINATSCSVPARPFPVFVTLLDRNVHSAFVTLSQNRRRSKFISFKLSIYFLFFLVSVRKNAMASGECLSYHMNLKSVFTGETTLFVTIFSLQQQQQD